MIAYIATAFERGGKGGEFEFGGEAGEGGESCGGGERAGAEDGSGEFEGACGRWRGSGGG